MSKTPFYKNTNIAHPRFKSDFRLRKRHTTHTKQPLHTQEKSLKFCIRFLLLQGKEVY